MTRRPWRYAGSFPVSGVRYVVSTMSEHLRSIQSPADIKRMSIGELTELAQEIRELLISSLSKTGGHLGLSPRANLSQISSKKLRPAKPWCLWRRP